MDSSHLGGIDPESWALCGTVSWPVLLMVAEHPEELDSFELSPPSGTGMAVEEVVGRCRYCGDLCRSVVGEGRRMVDQSGGPGRSALVDHNQGMGHGKWALNHRGGVGYEYNPERRTVVAVGRGILKEKTSMSASGTRCHISLSI